jgi:hypothetical protein
VYRGHYLLSLRDAVAITNSPVLPESSPELLVEGEFVRIRRNFKGAYNLFGEWRYMEQDLSAEKNRSQVSPTPSASTESNVELELGALILIQLADAQAAQRNEAIHLDLVQWIDESHAERIGLLTNYHEEFRSDLIQNLPKI